MADREQAEDISGEDAAWRDLVARFDLPGDPDRGAAAVAGARGLAYRTAPPGRGAAPRAREGPAAGEAPESGSADIPDRAAPTYRTTTTISRPATARRIRIRARGPYPGYQARVPVKKRPGIRRGSRRSLHPTPAAAAAYAGPGGQGRVDGALRRAPYLLTATMTGWAIPAGQRSLPSRRSSAASP